jgi:hypothetical protein
MSQPLLIASSATLNFRVCVCSAKMTSTLTALQIIALPAHQNLQEQMDVLDASSTDVKSA